MSSGLNQDILHIICGWLAEERDFGSLFHCALAAKVLAVPAIANLYRVHNKAPAIAAASDDSLLALDRGKATAKWALLWRSIILSCFDEKLTYDRYARSIRKLDLEELSQMLDGQTFRGRIGDQFFEGPLHQFRVDRTTGMPKGKSKASNVNLDAAATANAVAKFVLPSTPLLEKLKGQFNSEIIKAFLPHTRRLQRLRVFEGSVLRETGAWYRENCHQFTKLGVYSWNGGDPDHDCASFLNEIRPQSLRSFGIFGGSKVSAESFLALNCHCNTLTRLELHSIDEDSMQHLSKFKDCVNLTALVLAENRQATADLENRHNDVFLELVQWLLKCKKLKMISFSKFISAPALMTHFLREPGVELESLELEGYSLAGSDEFHRALALQKSLKSLYLKGEDSEGPADNNHLVESLSRLSNLKDLRLTQISANFTEYHIRVLAKSLPFLETFWTGGFHITDAIWEAIKELRFLQRLELNADTRFTANGILDFVISLNEKAHQGFSLYIMMQDTDCDIPESELELIRDTLAARVGGRFDFQLVRAPEEEDYSDDSD